MDTGFEAANAKRAQDWIYPEALFRHFFGDVLHVPSNPALAKRFAAILHAHERVSDDLSQDARGYSKRWLCWDSARAADSMRTD